MNSRRMNNCKFLSYNLASTQQGGGIYRKPILPNYDDKDDVYSLTSVVGIFCVDLRTVHQITGGFK